MWKSEYAAKAVIDKGIGDVALNGTISVSPTQTTTYTITVTGQSGTASANVTVNITYPVPTITIKASPERIISGGSSVLSWNSTNATSAAISGIGSVDVNGSVNVSPAETMIYTITVTGPGGTSLAKITVNVNYPPPTVNIQASPLTVKQGESITLTWNSTNSISALINGIGDVAINGTMAVSPSDTTTYTITVKGLDETTNTASVTVVVNNQPQIPSTSINAASDVIEQGQSTMLSWITKDAKNIYIDNGIGSVAASGSISISPINTTTYVITAINSAGSSSARVVVKVIGHPQALPDGSFGKNYEDLIPKDSTVKAYDSKRFAIITGTVNDINKTPIEGVFVTIYNHPEYGTVSTDSTGRFSIPVEGGGIVTLVYKKDGFITSHRQVNAPWVDFAIADTVQLIAEDTATTKVTFDGNSNTVVTHKSTEIKDEFGNRACTMIFTGDNNAYSVDANGNVISKLDTIVTRATEFIKPESMPAVLPPVSAFTYCAELKVDGVERVKFEKPVVTWVDNFLNFPVGTVVPVGYYDRDRGVWVPSNNGVVVQLLDTNSDGIVDALDSNGDGKPDDLNKDGSFSDEVKGLNDPAKYKPGATFWRVEITHFTPWDCNWPYGPPGDAISPNPNGEPDTDEQKSEEEDCQGHNNSFVEERSRIFHEDIPIPGTKMTLHYASNRVEGYKHKITIPVSGNTFPVSLKNIIVDIKIAGREFNQNLNPLPNQTTEFNWDRLDQFGREVKGSVYAHVSIGFVYDAVYYTPGNFTQAFGQAGSYLTIIRARQEIISWKNSYILISNINKTIAKGWTCSYHHQLDNTNVLYKGDGKFKNNYNGIITTIAGNGNRGYSGDGGFATQAKIGYHYDSLAIDAIGNLYFADSDYYRIRKVDTNGIITTIAGNGNYGYSGDGGPAAQAELTDIYGLAIDSIGNLYICDNGYGLIRKVDTNGIITTIAGNGISGYSGDGGHAIRAQIDNPYGITIDAAGNLYIGENCRIRKIDPNGIITTIAGNGISGYSGDGGPAIQAKINYPLGIKIDTVGNIYFIGDDGLRIRKVDTNGIITTIAGNGNYGYSGDGGPAIQAGFGGLWGITIDNIGNIYVTDGCRIRKINTSGIITTIAGNGNCNYSGDGGPAIQAGFGGLFGLALDAANNIYLTDLIGSRIRKISPFIIRPSSSEDILFPEEDGIGHIISNSLHKKTIDLNTNIVLREFVYDQNNNLASITDQFNNQITIQRDNNNVPTTIISPDGMMTKLIIDSNNNLTQIIYPDTNFYSFRYTSDGLMTAKIDPKGNNYTHSFDANGKLTDVFDEEGGNWYYDRTVDNYSNILTKVLTGEGNLTTYLDHTDSTGAYTSTITSPTGAETLFNQSRDGLNLSKSLPCGMALTFKYAIDPQYKFKYIKQMTETTPSGLIRVTSKDKIYEDTNSDKLPDRITEKVTVNGKIAATVQNTLQSKKTITSPEGRSAEILYDSAALLIKSITVPGFYDTLYNYDVKGRMISISANTRNISFTYDNIRNF